MSGNCWAMPERSRATFKCISYHFKCHADSAPCIHDAARAETKCSHSQALGRGAVHWHSRFPASIQLRTTLSALLRIWSSENAGGQKKPPQDRDPCSWLSTPGQTKSALLDVLWVSRDNPEGVCRPFVGHIVRMFVSLNNPKLTFVLRNLAESDVVTMPRQVFHREKMEDLYFVLSSFAV